LWGYGGAALLYVITACWLRQPLLLTPAGALAVVPYAIVLQRSPLPPQYYGLALLPGAATALALGWWLDRYFGTWDDFPWATPVRWGVALAERLLNWWSLPLYALGLGLAAASPFFTNSRSDLSALSFFLLALLFGWAVYRFRLRFWLLAAAVAGHAAVVAWFIHQGWWAYAAETWLKFMPVTILTTLAAMAIARRLNEGSPLKEGRLWAGWSRPLYLLAGLDILVGQISSLSQTQAGAMVTLSHTLLIAALAAFWASSWLPYLATVLGAVALVQWASAQEGVIQRLPAALALLALGYGLVGYGLALFRRRLPPNLEMRAGAKIWEIPLQRSGLGLSVLVLGLTVAFGLDLVGWTVGALIGLPFREVVELETVYMVVRVFGLLGLLYLAAAFHHRYIRLGYAAMAMLLTAWMLYAFYIQEWASSARVQWYAIPAGLYLLGVAWLEWRRGNKVMARWIDYAAMLLMLGSLFWQTLLFGWLYFLMLLVEGLAAIWWGSARRLRRFLYAGIVGVTLGAVGQLVQLLNALSPINQWLLFGLVGLLLVAIAAIVEQKREELKEWQDLLEEWE
jgi:hypothetical protein